MIVIKSISLHNASKAVSRIRIKLGVSIVCLATALCGPPLAYASSLGRADETHPFVFFSKADFLLLLRKNSAITKDALAHLEFEAGRDVDRVNVLSAPYSGCDLETYSSRFSWGGNSAALALATLTTYAYLAHLTKDYGKDDLAKRAIESAKTIMLGWAQNGLQTNGRFRSDPHEFCSKNPSNNNIANLLSGFTVGRSIPYWIESQDLLDALNALDSSDRKTLDAFDDNLQKLILASFQEKSAHDTLQCDKYNNQTSSDILDLIVLSRYFNQQKNIKQLENDSGSIFPISWVEELNSSIYGIDDQDRTCYGYDKVTTFYKQTKLVGPGEVIDRYRAEGKQPFGYTLGSLTNQLESASLLNKEGFNAINYVGDKKQTLPLSLKYYSFYFENFAAVSATTLPKTFSKQTYPAYSQYAGHPFSSANGATIDGRDGLIIPYLIATSLYPSDPSVNSVIQHIGSFTNAHPLSGIDPMFLPYLANVK